ncbi:IS200/IS605 family transposase [Bacillus cereus]|uniref:Transposase n=1 Tax=Bacillus cereus TaxID=1396 RepID=A0A162PGK9_BACCE|nr:IS200/IS605 family transposase [Bacillus cereus]KZD71919.1 transposase [Bacillus cereus]
MTEFNKNRRAFFKLTYHLVVTTQNRTPYINDQVKTRLEEIVNDLFSKRDCSIKLINTECDYIHIKFEAPPHLNLTTIINNFKSVSSRYIRKEFKDLLSTYPNTTSFWNPHYMIITSGDTVAEAITHYTLLETPNESKSTPQ